MGDETILYIATQAAEIERVRGELEKSKDHRRILENELAAVKADYARVLEERRVSEADNDTLRAELAVMKANANLSLDQLTERRVILASMALWTCPQCGGMGMICQRTNDAELDVTRFPQSQYMLPRNGTGRAL